MASTAARVILLGVLIGGLWLQGREEDPAGPVPAIAPALAEPVRVEGLEARSSGFSERARRYYDADGVRSSVWNYSSDDFNAVVFVVSMARGFRRQHPPEVCMVADWNMRVRSKATIRPVSGLSVREVKAQERDTGQAVRAWYFYTDGVFFTPDYSERVWRQYLDLGRGRPVRTWTVLEIVFADPGEGPPPPKLIALLNALRATVSERTGALEKAGE